MLSWRWWFSNLGRFLISVVLGSFVIEVYGILAAPGANPIQAYVIDGLLGGIFFGAFMVPGLVVYLVVIIALGRSWSGRRMRIAAICLSPIVGGLLWKITGPDTPWVIAPLALTTPLIFGAIVRLPPAHQRSGGASSA